MGPCASVPKLRAKAKAGILRVEELIFLNNMVLILFLGSLSFIELADLDSIDSSTAEP